MDERSALLALMLVDGIGAVRLRRLRSRYTSALEAWKHRKEWPALPGFSRPDRSGSLYSQVSAPSNGSFRPWKKSGRSS